MLKEKQNNTACLFVQISLDGSDTWGRYNTLSADAVSSFKTYHPDVDVHLITNDNVHDYINTLESINGEKIEIYDQAGIFKFIMGYHLMKSHNYLLCWEWTQ
jgi:predicted TPR repeat methyltransferase